jgi:hypothetical protein
MPASGTACCGDCLHCIIRQLPITFSFNKYLNAWLNYLFKTIPQSALLADAHPQAAETDGADNRLIGTVRHRCPLLFSTHSSGFQWGMVQTQNLIDFCFKDQPFRHPRFREYVNLENLLTHSRRWKTI